MLRAALVPTLVVDVLTVVAFWLAAGPRAGLAVLLAVTVATTFFAAGLFVMGRLAGVSPVSFLAAALAVYLGQVLFLGIVIVALSGASWLDGTAFGLGALVVALAWQVFQVVAFLRMRKAVYDGGTGAADAPHPAG